MPFVSLVMTTAVAEPTAALPVPDPAAMKYAKAPTADSAIARMATIATQVRLLERFISFLSSFPIRGSLCPPPDRLRGAPGSGVVFQRAVRCLAAADALAPPSSLRRGTFDPLPGYSALR